MAAWQDNLRRHLTQKEVLILHGNVRDTAYIKEDGTLLPGLSDVIREAGKEGKYNQIIFWGVFFDHEDKGHSPIWSLERIESFDGEPAKIRTTNAEQREIVILTRWLQENIRDVTKKTIFLINYIDKITPYSDGGRYPEKTALLVTVIEKIIENITANNRLIMVALKDTMLPIEYYTHSPKVAVMGIPIPDKEERKAYFTAQFQQKFQEDQIQFLANITDGLYVRDMQNIVNDILSPLQPNQQITDTVLKEKVNQYRIGTIDDPWSTLPLQGSEKGLIDGADKWFKKSVVGQDHAVDEVIKAIKKARAGVVGMASGQQSKPRAIFFFAGPTGTGKTFLAKKLAEYLFDSQEAFTRLDMSEFKEDHTVSKLIGSPPGYVGFEQGGLLTNAVKGHPFSVILFDEIEKAHPKIMDIFLQILDDGRLTDSRGQTVFFTESVIIFTSNIGTRATDGHGHPIKERDELEKIIAAKTLKEQKEEEVRGHFTKAVHEFFTYEISRPELLNRIGSHIIAFNYIDNNDAMQNMIQSKLKDIAKNFGDKFHHRGYTLIFTDNVAEYFIKKYRGSIEKFGGRGMVNVIDDEVGHLLANQILLEETLNRPTPIAYTTEVVGGKLECRRS